MSGTVPHGSAQFYTEDLEDTAPHRPYRLPGKTSPSHGLGPWGALLQLMGVMVGVVLVSLIVGLAVRSIWFQDVLNPFRPDAISTLVPPGATLDPRFAAPTLDVGQLEAWHGTDRVTILLLGADTRPAERGLVLPRTDSIMLLTIDPVANTAGVLSVPRDLYVDIPGYGLNRINTAYVFGGGDLAKQTVTYNLGVRVDYYVLVEFDAFVTLINEIGGIDVNVPYDIYDPEYPDNNYGYDPFYIQAGWHHMDGALALKYARTRHTSSDFDRARRQQDVLFAIRERVLSLDMMPTLVQRAPGIYATMSDSIQTDMTLDDMLRLALLVQDIPRESIRTGVIDGQYVMGYTTSTGASVLIPNRERMGSLVADVFSLSQ